MTTIGMSKYEILLSLPLPINFVVLGRALVELLIGQRRHAPL
jgi:hypothetical protein